MKVLIVSYFYFPESTPRAHRAYELAQEIKRLGHQVEVVTCRNEQLSYNENEVNLVKPGFFLNKTKRFNPTQEGANVSKLSHLSRFLRPFLVFYNRLFGGRTFEASLFIYRWLKENCDSEYDICISVGLPFCSHFATALARRRGYLRVKNLVFDYGDPFYKNKHMNLFYSGYLLEKACLKEVDVVTVPIRDALQNFSCFEKNFTTYIVPQGFNFDSKILTPRIFKAINKKPIVAFAGNFYPGIRNPIPFFRMLYKEKFQNDFHLILYTDHSNYFNNEVIDEVRKLGFQFEVKSFIERQKLIASLKNYDFLLNFGNSDPTAVPSKLIDYAIAQRPILTVTSDAQDAIAKFKEFIDGDYSSRTKIDLKDYHISKVAKQFLRLCD